MCIHMTLHCYIPSLGPALLLLAVGDVPLLVGDVPLLVGDVPLLVGGVPLLVGEISFTRPQEKTNKTLRCGKQLIIDGMMFAQLKCIQCCCSMHNIGLLVLNVHPLHYYYYYPKCCTCFVTID